ncbi:nuclear transport factor 2 family protein [Rhizobium sp. TH2]|uniref:nuclear transport factor 2 family protein n=1 Tax=Rhizobium sp. TH2 TaxID=2775403 RepID=UPI002157F42F|nr:nuclear transport factor 2 family protein [Rhizobium sp. TH2]UVC06761.1 nuclear transport factor 2 family protein [Rhizobium sp. TH2]
MSSREEIEGLVFRLQAARDTQSVDQTLACIDQSCTFRVVGTDELSALTAVNDTPEKLRGAATALIEVWDLSGLRNVSIHIDGDTALVHRAGTVTFKPTGVTMPSELMEKITFKDGLIVEYLQFADTYQIAGTMGIIPA